MCQQLADEIQDLLDQIDVESASETQLRAVVEDIADLVAGEEEEEDEEDDDEDDEDENEVEVEDDEKD